MPPSAISMLARSDAELVAAQLAGQPDERYLHAHLSALRAGAALLHATGRPSRRRALRTVWDEVAFVDPGLGPWSAFFADGAAARAAIEAGRGAGITARRADEAVAAAEDFGDAVRERLGAPAAPGRRVESGLRAS